MEKMTSREGFEQVKKLLADNADMVAWADAEIAKINKRNESAKNRVTAKQVANAELAKTVVALLTETPITITELQKNNPELAEYSNQKLSAILNAEVTDTGSVVRTVVKRKAYFAKA